MVEAAWMHGATPLVDHLPLQRSFNLLHSMPSSSFQANAALRFPAIIYTHIVGDRFTPARVL